MFLSPAEIQHQNLRTSRGKYRRDDVDYLLENVAASYEQVWLERDGMRGRVEELESELKTFKEMEQVFRDSIVAGHRTADELRAEAAREAEEILEEARRKAAEIVDEASHERERLQGDIGRLQSLEQDTTERYRGLLLTALEALERDRPSPAEPEPPEPAAEAEPAKTALDTADWEIPYALYEDEDEEPEQAGEAAEVAEEQEPEAAEEFVEASDGRRRRGRSR